MSQDLQQLDAIDESKMGGSTLGEHRFGMIVNTVSMTLSLCGVEGFLIWFLIWTSDNSVWIRVGPLN